MKPDGHLEMPGAAARLDAVFASLSDPTRRALLARLAAGESSVAQLAAPFSMTQPAISKHLKVLEAAGLVVCNPDAQRRLRRLNASALAEAAEWLADYRKLWKDAEVPHEASAGEPKGKKKKDKKHKHKKH